MTNGKHRDDLDRLTDALVKDILSAPDDDILEEAAEEHEDTSVVANRMRELFEATASEVAKERLIAAKASAQQYRQQAGAVIDLAPEAARRRFEKLMASDPELQRKLTMAARNDEELSDRDIQNILEDLKELGELDDED